MHTIRKNEEGLVVSRKEAGIEVNVDTTKYMVMTRDQNSGRSHYVNIDNRSFERVGKFKKIGNNLK